MLEKIIIKKATYEDIEEIKKIADDNKKYIGFVIKGALIKSLDNKQLLVAKQNHDVIGFVNYRHRKDDHTVLYEICVKEDFRRKGIGSLLLDSLVSEAKKHNKKAILLKCPIDGMAHKFYLKYGFSIKSTRNKSRKGTKLIVWVYQL